MSRNHYNPKWSFFNGGSHRRLKNVICLLEWVPDTTQLDPGSKRFSPAESGAAQHAPVSDKHMQSLRATFDRYDTTKRGQLSLSEFKQLLQALEFTAGIADMDLDSDAGAHVSCKLGTGPNGIRTVRVIETSGDGVAIAERNNVDERELSRLLYKLGVISTPGAEHQSEVFVTFENVCMLMNDHERYLTEVSPCRRAPSPTRPELFRPANAAPRQLRTSPLTSFAELTISVSLSLVVRTIWILLCVPTHQLGHDQ